MKSERLGQWVYFGLAGLFLLFIAYVSWSPAPADDFLPQHGFFRNLERLPSLLHPHHFRDFATNIVLYVPLGVLLALAIAAGKRRFVSRWLLIGFIASVVMEAGQSVFGRYPDALDIITNSLGYLIGYSAVAVAVRFYGLDPMSLIGFDAVDGGAATQTIAAARFACICVYVLVAMLPFDVTVIYYKIYAQLFPDSSGLEQIVLNPLYHASHWPQSTVGLVVEVLLLLPIAVLSALLNFVKGRFDVLTAVFPCVMVALFCDAAQVFILSRTTDIAMFPVAIAAGLSGWAVVKAWYGLRGVRTRAANPMERSVRWRWKVIALIASALLILLLSLWPFHFEFDHRAVAEKIFHERNVVPFRYTTGAWHLVSTAVAFVPLGFLLSSLLLESPRPVAAKKLILLSGLICACVSLLTEHLQSICVGRYFDVTGVLLALVGGVLGSLLLRPFRKTAS